MIVVDASLFVAWLLNEPGHAPDEALWDALAGETMLVPSHWPNEIANALRKAVRMKRLSIDEIVPIAERIKTFDISLAEPTRTGDIAELAKNALRHDVSAYDMIYLRLAHEYGAPLGTIDRAMRAAAGELRVSVLPA